MIGVTFALPAESSQFVRLLNNPSREERDGVAIVAGQYYGAEIRVLHTGVGAEIARRRVANLFRSELMPKCVIAAGFAGSLVDEWPVGDLILAENFSDPKLLRAARAALGSSAIHSGKLLSVNQILDSPEARRDLARETGCVAVDMETETIAHACAAAGVPMLSLRAITDTPLVPFPMAPGILFNVARQKTLLAPLVWHLAMHPAAIGRLIGFARRVAAARNALTNALEILLRETLR